MITSLLKLLSLLADLFVRYRTTSGMQTEYEDAKELAFRRAREANQGDSIQTLVNRNKS